MTIQQEAYEKINTLPDDTVRLLIEIMNKFIHAESTQTVEKTSAKSEKLLAFERLEEMKKNSPVPKDFDFVKAREEAMKEKYGI